MTDSVSHSVATEYNRSRPIKKWEYLSRHHLSKRWLVGNSQMAKFSGHKDYQITYKRGARLEEIVREAEWLTTVGATHIVIDGVQNSVKEIIQGRLQLERTIQPRLKTMNQTASVVLAECLYCPEHVDIIPRLQWINRSIRRINKEASGSETPRPWTVLGENKRSTVRSRKDSFTFFPDAFGRDGYHINVAKIEEYEQNIANYLRNM